MTDILLYESGNGGDISLKNGDIETIDGFENQAYLAHFGGNIEASTTNEELAGQERSDWWGNTFFPQNRAMQMNSNLERTLNNTALNSAGRITIENEAKNDLEYLSEIADVSSVASIIGVDKVQISDKIDLLNNSYLVTNNEIIEEKTI